MFFNPEGWIRIYKKIGMVLTLPIPNLICVSPHVYITYGMGVSLAPPHTNFIQ
jgi:hypothetical protein